MKCFCIHCKQEYEREQIDMSSIMRRREFEKNLGFEVSIRVWECLCDGCQSKYIWLSKSLKNLCSRHWHVDEELHEIHEKGVKP